MTIENDYIEDLLMTRVKDTILFFTNKGRVYKMKAYRIPEASRTSRGTAIVNLLQLDAEEKISALIPISEYDENKDLFFVTRQGIVKKTSNADFANIRKTGIIAIDLRDNDELIEVKQTTKDDDIIIVTRKGMAIRFREDEVRNTGRSSMGVVGIRLQKGDEVIGMQLSSQGDSVIGKRTEFDKFKIQHRGGRGVKCYNIKPKTGEVVGVKAVNDDHEIMMITSEGIIIQIRMSEVSIRMMITSEGIIIQIRMSEVSIRGRDTSGVKLIDLKDGVKVVAIAKVRDAVEDETQEDAGDASEDETRGDASEGGPTDGQE